MVSTSKSQIIKFDFLNAVNEARDTYGHDGYTGSIAEKDKYISCSDTIFSSRKEAYDYVESILEGEYEDKRISDKWGPAGYVKFKSEYKASEFGYMFFGYASS